MVVSPLEGSQPVDEPSAVPRRPRRGLRDGHDEPAGPEEFGAVQVGHRRRQVRVRRGVLAEDVACGTLADRQEHVGGDRPQLRVEVRLEPDVGRRVHVWSVGHARVQVREEGVSGVEGSSGEVDVCDESRRRECIEEGGRPVAVGEGDAGLIAAVDARVVADDVEVGVGVAVARDEVGARELHAEGVPDLVRDVSHTSRDERQAQSEPGPSWARTRARPPVARSVDFFAPTRVTGAMQVLVTGGAGFIGGHLAERFVRDGHDVTVLDDLDPFYDVRIKEQTIEVCRDLAADGDGAYHVVEDDVRDADLVGDLVAEADVVYHQAAQAGVRGSVENPRKYDAVNVDGTLNVLDAARATGVERVVLASSSSVYGKPRYLPYDEDHLTTPVSPYGASKLAAERYAMAYDAVYDLDCVALRYFTVYGPRMRPNMAITNFVSRCLHDEPPVVYGDGSQTRDFTYVDDVVRANAALLETDAADGEVLNVGSTDNIDILSLAEEVRDLVAPDLEITFAERHDADAEHTHADVAKAGDLLGYEPTYSIREGVAAFVEWYRENEDWYDPLVRAS